jgi:hypothetical protein
MLLLLPLIILTTGNWVAIPYAIALDYIVNSAIAMWAAGVTKRWTVFGAMPYFYFLRWVEIFVHLKAFVEVIILGKFKTSTRGWSVADRRYKLNQLALTDVAT